MTQLPVVKLSASAYKTYKDCARKYYYTYIERLPRKKWPHLDLGNFVHKVLELFHEDKSLKKKKSKEARKILLLKYCKQEVKNFPLTDEHKAKAREMLLSYLDMLERKGLPDVVSNEQGFSIKLNDEEIEVVVRGYIDRIDRVGDKLKLLDYKSGRSKYLDEFQLLVYGLYLLNEYPDIETFKGEYLMLGEGCKTLPYNFTKTDALRVKEKIIKTAKEIKQDKTWEPKPTRLCDWCDFKDHCPAHNPEWVAN